ncbi:MAG TPA: hypothetical protein VFQ47_00335 [Nitrososphaera sp.]|nr:hypothetical protein [Nitrososphaera sp.]
MAWFILSGWGIRQSTNEFQPYPSLRVWSDSSSSNSINPQIVEVDESIYGTLHFINFDLHEETKIRGQLTPLLSTRACSAFMSAGLRSPRATIMETGVLSRSSNDLYLFSSRKLGLAYNQTRTSYSREFSTMRAQAGTVNFALNRTPTTISYLLIATTLSDGALATISKENIFLTSRNEFLFPFRKFIRGLPYIIVQVSPPESNGFKKDLLFWVSLFGLIVSPITSITTILFTWISLHRKRAEEILLHLELQKRELEIQQLQIELERSRLEAEKQKSGLIVVTS